MRLLKEQDIKLDTCENMKKYGGSFVKALAECILRADENNLIKLESAFHEYINSYRPSNLKTVSKL